MENLAWSVSAIKPAFSFSLVDITYSHLRTLGLRPDLSSPKTPFNLPVVPESSMSWQGKRTRLLDSKKYFRRAWLKYLSTSENSADVGTIS